MMTENLRKDKKSQHFFRCELCEHITSKKSDYAKHLSTRKHKMMTQKIKDDKKLPVLCCESCDKGYSSRQALWRHKKLCEKTATNVSSFVAGGSIPLQPFHKKSECNKNAVDAVEGDADASDMSDEDGDTDSIIAVVSDVDDDDADGSGDGSEDNTKSARITIDKDVLLQILCDNREFKKIMIEQNEKMIELLQADSSNRNMVTNNNVTNNNNNTNNNQFNLNVFLNEKCRDAVNWTDFIKGIELTKEDLLRTGEMGFVNGMSHIIIENLKKLSEDKRPLHNTDCKRKTVYIRDDGTWEVQEDYRKFGQAAGMISDKTKIVWINTNDEHLSIEEDDALMRACCRMAATTEHMEKIPKIVNNVIREVIVKKK
jgi:hypothetical protein